MMRHLGTSNLGVVLPFLTLFLKWDKRRLVLWGGAAGRRWLSGCGHGCGHHAGGRCFLLHPLLDCWGLPWGGRSAALPLPLDTHVHTHMYTHTDMLRRRQGLEGKVNAEQTVQGLFGKKLYIQHYVSR